MGWPIFRGYLLAPNWFKPSFAFSSLSTPLTQDKMFEIPFPPKEVAFSFTPTYSGQIVGNQLTHIAYNKFILVQFYYIISCSYFFKIGPFLPAQSLSCLPPFQELTLPVCYFAPLFDSQTSPKLAHRTRI